MSRFELPTVRTKRDARLVELHLELQAMICNRLSYIDLHQLSCVNRFYRALVTKDFMRSCFTDAQWDTELRAVCRDCQRHAPLGGRVIAYTWEAFENPLGGYCTVCSLQGGRLREISSVWAYGDGLACQTPICLWCGWPTWTEEMLHDACASKYERGRIICMCLTWLRSGLSLSAYGLLWRHFRSRETVIPTVVSIPFQMRTKSPSIQDAARLGKLLRFVWLTGLFKFAFLLSCCLNTAFVYGDEAKRKKLLLFFAVEFIVLCLWIPPLYSIAKIVRDKPDNDSIDVAVALLVLITVNM